MDEALAPSRWLWAIAYLITFLRTRRLMRAAALSCVLAIGITGSAGVAVNMGNFSPAEPAVPRVGIALPLGRCINLGGYLEARDWGTQRAPEQEFFQDLRQHGFNSIRLPIKWDARLGPDDKIDPRWYLVIDQHIERAHAAGLNVIIDLHHFHALDVNPTGNADKFVDLWEQIARHYASAPENLWFELLNEPHGNLTNLFLFKLYRRAIDKIRVTNPTRPIIVMGALTNAPDTLAAFEVPNDPYVVPEFHTYAPLSFSHQGAPWVKPVPPSNVAFNPAIDLLRINAVKKVVHDFMERTGRVPVALEFGAIRFAPRDDRLRYYNAVSGMISSLGIYSCVWTDSVFPLEHKNTWDTQLLDQIQTVTQQVSTQRFGGALPSTKTDEHSLER